MHKNTNITPLFKKECEAVKKSIPLTAFYQRFPKFLKNYRASKKQFLWTHYQCEFQDFSA